MIECIPFVDTHTGGEPTRIVVGSPIDLAQGTLHNKRQRFQEKFDRYRQAIVCEPRGSDVMVGALLTAADLATSEAGVIFFNNVGFLGMCGHGTMGVAVALAYLGRIHPGAKYQLDTPVGCVEFELESAQRVSLRNVPSYRFRAGVSLEVEGRGIHGDVAWGGNWFYICEDHGLRVESDNLAELERFARKVRAQLESQGVTGAAGAPIDHIELIGPATGFDQADARNYVLCPGGAFDRSPCGTGTSAKLACLAADGKLSPDQIYRQQSIIGSVFEASYQPLAAGKILPRITGQAFVSGEGKLLIDDADPFAMGFTPGKMEAAVRG
jgi:4-hydroxyproline epimerase